MIREKWNISKEYKDASIFILTENLSSLRAKIGINQEELANVIGMSRQSYYAIENKDRKMMWGTFLSLVFFFGICADTAEMLKELRIFPIDLVMRFNEQL